MAELISVSDELVLSVHENAPTSTREWNALATLQGNLLQATYYDEVMTFYNQHPVYFELHKGDTLVAGLKLYQSWPRKLSAVKNVTGVQVQQFGEWIEEENLEGRVRIPIQELLLQNADAFLRKTNASVFRADPFYGKSSRMITLEQTKRKTEKKICIARMDLYDQNFAEQIHPMHKRNISRAERQELTFSESTDIDTFISLQHQSFLSSPDILPDKDFVRHRYQVLHMHDCMNIYTVSDKYETLSAAMVHEFGGCAYYIYGGNKKNNSGAGTWLHWKIMNHLRARSFQFYFLGQMATGNEPKKNKFTQGITLFKQRFVPESLPVASRIFTLRPVARAVTQATIKLASWL